MDYKVLGRHQDNPLVSVVIPTANRHKLLDIAVNSVLGQTYTEVEIIIVDDGSHEPVDAKVYDSKRVRVIRNDVCVGGGKSRNIGADASCGEYVCFLDDDDWYFPEKVATLMQVFRDRPDVDAVFGRILRESGKFTEKRFPIGCLTDIRKVSLLHTNSSLIRRGAFEEVRFCEELKKFQDTQFHIELISSCNVYCVPSYVAFWKDAYAGDRITSMNTGEHVIKSIDSFDLLVKYFVKMGLAARDLRWLHRARVRHRAKFGCGLDDGGLADVFYYVLVRALYVMSRRAQ